ncbi:hypothetical protein [Agriterribacter sp.]|uniref:hypothetical protein n=1 Tax=Agriterribacter sp. TaxID=2821509 RepID=UPI002BF3EC84|nr:hypothetical protein [Agriterribacter sp.]HRO46210.1 hypothetical protein [Agriterribacter sp.]HRQ16324.1 hypothetical protein [Agriterribacter sp.]
MKKFLRISLLLIVVVLAIFIYVRYYFVLGEGVKSGELNYCVKKGYVFKTYEGKLIQTGIRSLSPNTIQSYDFEFSVTNENVARTLMSNSGMVFDLYYREYKGALPWRGFSRYIVDSIVAMKDPRTGNLVR